MKLLSRFPAIKRYRIPVLLLLCGIVSFILSLYFNLLYKEAVIRKASLLAYISYLLLLFSVLVFAVKKKKHLITNLAVLLILLVGLETVCFFLLGMPYKAKKNFDARVFPTGDIRTHVGYVLPADSIIDEVKVKGKDTLVHFHATIDQYNKRATPGNDTAFYKYALFFGCSICYGYGLEDNETLPYYFQQESGAYKGYNYGNAGYGTQQMLARLEYQDIHGQVRGNDGYAFYVFFWDHIKRAIGCMDRYTDWVSDTPYYTMENGTLVRKKMFTNGRPFLSWIYEQLYQMNIIKYFKIDFPVRISDRHYDLVTEIIKRSKEEYQKQFGNDNFYVLFYPTYKDYTPEEFARFKSYLDKKGIKYLDLSEFIKYSPEYTLRGDPHPAARTNKLIADEMLRQLKIKNINQQ